MSKLKLVKVALRNWNKLVFKNRNKQVVDVEANMKAVRNRMSISSLFSGLVSVGAQGS